MTKPKIDISSRAKLVLNAIDSPKYKARTVGGIAKEVNLPVNVVVEVIKGDELRGSVVRVPGVRKNNKPLYVTVERYKKRTPMAVRILNMLKKDSTDEQ